MITIAVTALLSCFLAMAAVLHTVASGGAAIKHQSDTVCPDLYGPMFTTLPVSLDTADAMVEIVRHQAAERGFSTPRVAMHSRLADTSFRGEAFRTRIGYAEQGLDHLELLEGDRSSGLWMGARLASVRDFGLGVRGNGGTLPAITGIYTDLERPAPRWWCSQQHLAVHNRIADHIPSGFVFFATDRETFGRALRSHPDLAPPRIERLSVTFDDPPPTTPAEATARLDRSRELIAAVDAQVRARGLPELTGELPFDRSVEIAEEAQGSVAFSILPLAGLSVLVGCGGIGTAGVQWYQRRHGQLRLLASRGSSPPALGGLAIAELGPPLVAGGIAGMVLARLLLPAYGPPGEVLAGDLWLGASAAAGVLVLALALLAVVVALRAHREFQLSRLGSRRRFARLAVLLPWELVTAALALLGWLRLRDHGGFGTDSDPLPQVDPLALTYPVFVVLTVGLLAARLVWLLLHASRRTRLWSRPALQLAIRRLAGARAPVTGVLVIGVLAVGTLTAGTGIAGGQRQALDTKTAMLVGGAAQMGVGSSVGLGEVPLPGGIRDESTVTGRLTGTGNIVLVVDPETFSRGAATEVVPGGEVQDLLGRLGAAGPDGIPAIRVGHTAAQSAELPGLPDAHPVADLPAFPLIGGEHGYVISRAGLSPDQLELVPDWRVVSAAPLREVSAALGAAGLTLHNPVDRATALDALPFYVVEWAFAYVSVLGVVLGVVAALGLLVAVEVRRRQNALAGALLLRMGLRPRALLGSHLLEHGALAGLAITTGVTCGIVVAGFSVPRFDPARWLAPRSELPDLSLFVVTVLATGALVVALAGWIAVRSVRTARTAELLRA
ncbi:FtsX-like permease family protein [Amycolatopsis cihanbeyliensis]